MQKDSFFKVFSGLFSYPTKILTSTESAILHSKCTLLRSHWERSVNGSIELGFWEGLGLVSLSVRAELCAFQFASLHRHRCCVSFFSQNPNRGHAVAANRRLLPWRRRSGRGHGRSRGGPAGIMSSGRGGAVEIPASTKKVVQSLKEIVTNSDEEIYAMLKECNMDLNETVQRLLNQGMCGALIFRARRFFEGFGGCCVA